jgi:hypothetical protein
MYDIQKIRDWCVKNPAREARVDFSGEDIKAYICTREHGPLVLKYINNPNEDFDLKMLNAFKEEKYQQYVELKKMFEQETVLVPAGHSDPRD